MYTSGGSMPTLVDVMLTADTELGLTRSLVTRQYLSTVGDRVVHSADLTELARRAGDRQPCRRRASITTWPVLRSRWPTRPGPPRPPMSGLRWPRSARLAGTHATLMKLTTVDRSDEYGRISKCGDWLTRLLSRSGYEGEDLREAWAIVMRESGGREDAVSAHR